jgi:hypothetical protein
VVLCFVIQTWAKEFVMVLCLFCCWVGVPLEVSLFIALWIVYSYKNKIVYFSHNCRNGHSNYGDG